MPGVVISQVLLSKYILIQDNFVPDNMDQRGYEHYADYYEGPDYAAMPPLEPMPLYDASMDRLRLHIEEARVANDYGLPAPDGVKVEFSKAPVHSEL